MYANNSTLITFIEMRKQFNQQIEKELVRKSPAAIYPVRIWEIIPRLEYWENYSICILL